MPRVEISKSDAKLLERLVEAGAYPSKDKALQGALKYLKSDSSISFLDRFDVKPYIGYMEKRAKDWQPYLNGIGKIQISAPDVYKIAKTGRSKLIASLRRDINSGHSFATSSAVAHASTDLSGEIVHDFNNEIFMPDRYGSEHVSNIPELHGDGLNSALSKGALSYLRAIFSTMDNESDIVRTLQTLSGKSSRDIKLYTWGKHSREDPPFMPFVMFNTFHENKSGRDFFIVRSDMGCDSITRGFKSPRYRAE